MHTCLNPSYFILQKRKNLSEKSQKKIDINENAINKSIKNNIIHKRNNEEKKDKKDVLQDMVDKWNEKLEKIVR